jgi:hypothetical protein
LKTVDIHLRPIFHWTAPRVRAHVLLCMLKSHNARKSNALTYFQEGSSD